VKLIKADGDRLVFQIGKREQRILLEVLKFYPVLPAQYQPLSRGAVPAIAEENQRLLDEAITEQRQQNRKQLDELLNDPHWFQEHEEGYRFTLSPVQTEWLLQVLNDVRVGSWLILGSPDEPHSKTIKMTDRNSHYLWAMEMGGYFQYRLLEALEGGG
jgi:hypothetical protein